ncbi:hypothetical protein MKX03_037498 [Papaver bracteatum]|nr:hypothetical protein MKX03_037498 [Papaver bracteatum]
MNIFSDSSDDEEFAPPVNLLSDANSSDDDEEEDFLFGYDEESDVDALLEGIESQEYFREVAEEEDDFFLSPLDALEDEFFLSPPESLEDDFFLEDGEEETEDQLVEYEESEADEEEIETRRRLLEPREVEFTSPSENRIKIQLEPRDSNDSTTNLVRAGSNGNDENVVCCSICMNPYSSQGDDDHQVSCLPCGHLYGLSCIQRWIKHSKQRYSKCPICNQKCALKDVVKLYVSSLPVVDGGKQENSVSFQPRDDIFKVHFAKYKEELADIKRELVENTKCCERLERISTQDEYVEGMRKSYEEHLNEFEEICEAYEKHINECKEELADTKREVMENTKCCEENSKRLELLERTVEEVQKEQANSRRVDEEIQQFFDKETKKIQQIVDQETKKIQQRTDKTIAGLQRKLKRKKNELDAKNRAVEQLTKATEAKDKRIEQLMKRIKRESGKRRKRRELQIQQMFKGGRLMDRAHRRSISEAKKTKAKDRKMEQSMKAIERQDLQIQPMSKRRRLMDPACRAVL